VARQNAFRHLDAPAGNRSAETRFGFEKEKSVNPGERIDAFAFFYCPDAVLAKTVLTSRRSRAAFCGICFPRIILYHASTARFRSVTNTVSRTACEHAASKS
jgi:hypothetical protein